MANNTSLIEGKYKHYKNENFDEFFGAIGIPYMARKMMALASPTMEFKKNDEEWTMTTISLMRTIEQKFKLDEDYDEHMPNVTLKSRATLDDKNVLVITSEDPASGDKTIRTYTFLEDEVIVTLTHSKAKNPTKRYFRRIKEE